MANQPTMTEVNSSLIQSIGYDTTAKTAYVQFKSGATFMYFDVASADYDMLRDAHSVGKYFNETFKHKYSYGRM